MYKLTVVGGPAKGESYTLRDSGETSIGRVEGNDVVLHSSKVSKKHCVLVVSNKDVQVKDVGSSNGTFVNGTLAKLKLIKPGDRVSVGEYVFELVKVEPPKPKTSLPANVVPIRGVPVAAVGEANAFDAPKNDAPPQDPLEKAKYYFDKHIINFVYNLNETYEWRALTIGMIAILTAAASLLSAYPILERVSDKLTNEAAGRALLLARQMVDRNAPFIFEHQETKVDVQYVERERGVLSAYVIDMDGRILAPGRKLNQNISEPDEGAFANSARNQFLKSEQAEQRVGYFGDKVGVAVPLRVFSSASGKNVIVAVSLVYFDKSSVVIDPGTEMLIYIEALIFAAIIGSVVFVSFYRLTLRPIADLNRQIDQVLKGNAQVVEKKYKMEELNPLIDVVNSALQRATAAGPGAMAPNASDEAIELLKFAGGFMRGSGLMVFSGEKKIVYWGPFIEEITGIRAEGALGQDVGAVARDSAFAAFVEDLFARVTFAGSEPVTEDFEFSGTSYRLQAMASGSPEAVKYYVIGAIKPEG